MGTQRSKSRLDGVKVADSSTTCENADNDVLHRAICLSVKAGVTWVAAVPNDEYEPVHDILIAANGNVDVPSAYKEVITVTGFADGDGYPGGQSKTNFPSGCFSYTQDDDTWASFSCYSATKENISAPAVCLRTTKPGGGYTYASGTSFAAPLVAGAAALYVQQHPEASMPANVKKALLKGLEIYPQEFSLQPGNSDGLLRVAKPILVTPTVEYQTGTLTMFDIDNNKPFAKALYIEPNTNLATSADGSTIAFGVGEQKHIQFYAPSVRQLFDYSAYGDISAIHYTPDGKQFAFITLRADATGEFVMFDAVTTAQTMRITTGLAYQQDFAFSPDGSLVYILGNYAAIPAFNTVSGLHVTDFVDPYDPFVWAQYSLAISPDGKTLYEGEGAGPQNCRIVMFDTATHASSTTASRCYPQSIVPLPDGAHVGATGNVDSRVSIYTPSGAFSGETVASGNRLASGLSTVDGGAIFTTATASNGAAAGWYRVDMSAGKTLLTAWPQPDNYHSFGLGTVGILWIPTMWDQSQW